MDMRVRQLVGLRRVRLGLLLLAASLPAALLAFGAWWGEPVGGLARAAAVALGAAGLLSIYRGRACSSTCRGPPT